MKRLMIALSLPLLAVALGGAGQPQRLSNQANSVMILGNSQAKECAENAKLVADQMMSPAYAVQTCTEALNIEMLTLSDRAATFNNRGVVRFGMPEEEHLAIGDFDAAANLVPSLGESYVNRGNVLMRENRFPEAVTEFNRALELGLEEPWKAYYNRGIAKEALEDIRGAYEDYVTARDLRPEWEPPGIELTRFQVIAAQ